MRITLLDRYPLYLLAGDLPLQQWNSQCCWPSMQLHQLSQQLMQQERKWVVSFRPLWPWQRYLGQFLCYQGVYQRRVQQAPGKSNKDQTKTSQCQMNVLRYVSLSPKGHFAYPGPPVFHNSLYKSLCSRVDRTICSRCYHCTQNTMNLLMFVWGVP